MVLAKVVIMESTLENYEMKYVTVECKRMLLSVRVFGELES